MDNNKLQAKDLFDVMVDTNLKVDSLISSSKTGSISRAGTVVNVVLMAVGMLLATVALLPQILTAVDLAFVTSEVCVLLFVGYAIFSCIIAVLTKVNTLVRLLTILVGIAPMAITVLLMVI